MPSTPRSSRKTFLLQNIGIGHFKDNNFPDISHISVLSTKELCNGDCRRRYLLLQSLEYCIDLNSTVFLNRTTLQCNFKQNLQVCSQKSQFGGFLPLFKTLVAKQDPGAGDLFKSIWYKHMPCSKGQPNQNILKMLHRNFCQI